MEEEEKAVLLALVDRANAGDVEACRILQARPLTLAKLESTGLAALVRESILETILPNQELLYHRHRLRTEPKLLAEQLAGPNPTPLERLLAEQASIDYMALRAVEIRHQKVGARDVVDLQVIQSRVDSAHRRFLASVRTLAHVRKLQLPDILQVNIGEKQVNMTAT